MIQTNAGDQGQIGIDQVHRIQASTEADFEHHGIQLSTFEQPEGRQRTHLEIGQGNFTTRGLDRSESPTQLFIARLAPIQQHTLVVTQQVR